MQIINITCNQDVIYIFNTCSPFVKIHVKAKFSYTARMPDELTFPKHAIIQNVNKAEEDWWKGDYGGQRQHWFPAIYVEEIEPENIDERVNQIQTFLLIVHDLPQI